MAKSASTDRSPGRGLNYEEITGLAELVSRLGLEELEAEFGGDRVRIVAKRAPGRTTVVTSPGAAPASVEVPIPESETKSAPEAAPAPVDNPKWKKISAPMVGTFYKSSAPGSAPFVQVGDRVQDDTVLCIIEAMKLMNEIKAEMAGTVRAILVENGMPVEYGQPIFVIEPA